MSSVFVDVSRNTNGLTPRPARAPSDACLHRDVMTDEATAFSRERGHPVFPVKLPGECVSMSIGELAPGASTTNHRHAYESLVYVLEGSGYTILEGRRFDFRAGDAFYTPPWCWHQHFASGEGPVRYITATNMPLLDKIGQTVIREEEV